MVPVTLFTVIAAGAYVIDEAALVLASDAREAMRRADMTVDYVARVFNVPRPKLSEQLNGQLPFTYFCRFGCAEIRRDTDFWFEFSEIQIARIDRAVVVRADIGALVKKADALLARLGEAGSRHKRMAKISLSDSTRKDAVSA